VPTKSDHHLTILIEGKKYPVSDCAHWQIEADGARCAEGYDLLTHPCSGCPKHKKRATDPFKQFREAQERAEARKKETGFAAGVATKVEVIVPAEDANPQATIKDAGLLSKAMSWAKAEMSAIISKLPDDKYEARMSACRACNSLDPLPEPQVGYCKACGCGRSARAELTVKGRMPGARCPLKRWES